jgi:hypothetical protein
MSDLDTLDDWADRTLGAWECSATPGNENGSHACTFTDLAHDYVETF